MVYYRLPTYIHWKRMYMTTAYDIPAEKLIDALSKKLEKENEVSPPEWSEFVRTGISRENPPENKDWWHLRTAAILRSVYKLGPVGISKLRRKYGGKKNRGHKPSKFYKGSGSIEIQG